MLIYKTVRFEAQAIKTRFLSTQMSHQIFTCPHSQNASENPQSLWHPKITPTDFETASFLVLGIYCLIPGRPLSKAPATPGALLICSCTFFHLRFYLPNSNLEFIHSFIHPSISPVIPPTIHPSPLCQAQYRELRTWDEDNLTPILRELPGKWRDRHRERHRRKWQCCVPSRMIEVSIFGWCSLVLNT